MSAQKRLTFFVLLSIGWKGLAGGINSKQFVKNYELLKAIPHKDCASDAKSDFSLDCTKSMQAYWRTPRAFVFQSKSKIW